MFHHNPVLVFNFVCHLVLGSEFTMDLSEPLCWKQLPTAVGNKADESSETKPNIRLQLLKPNSTELKVSAESVGPRWVCTFHMTQNYMFHSSYKDTDKCSFNLNGGLLHKTILSCTGCFFSTPVMILMSISWWYCWLDQEQLARYVPSAWV